MWCCLPGRCLRLRLSCRPCVQSLAIPWVGQACCWLCRWGCAQRRLSALQQPARLLGVLRGFAHRLGLPARARAAFIRQIERDVGMQIARLDVTGYQLELPGLVVHAADDALVPADEAHVIHKSWFDSRLMLLEEGGHQRVLADPRLSEAVLELLARAEAVSVGAASVANIGIAAGAIRRGV